MTLNVVAETRAPRVPFTPTVTEAATKRVGIYARLSRDRDGRQTATERQITDCRALAAARGWNGAGVYQDTDLSAYSGVVRPEYERMLRDVEAGVIDGVLVWKLDRLVRSPREFERFWAVCERAGATLAAVNDPVDTSSEVGLLVVRMLVGFARLESATIGVRIRSVFGRRADEGEPHMGGTRPFGLTADRKGVDADEAELIHEAARRVLTGESLRSIVLDWRRRDVRTPTGRHWSHNTLRGMLINPRIVGDRVHRGKLIPATGKIPALLERETHERLVALFSDPGRLTRSPGRPRTTLSGFLRCGRCGGPMVATSRGKAQRSFRCQNNAHGTGATCGNVQIVAGPVECLLRDMIGEVLDSPELAAALEARDKTGSAAADAEEARRYDAALEELARDFYVHRVISRQEFFAAKGELETRIAAVRRRIQVRDGQSVLHGFVGAGEYARTQWDVRGTEWQRAIVGALIDHVVIAPADRSSPRRFQPERVRVVWRY